MGLDDGRLRPRFIAQAAVEAVAFDTVPGTTPRCGPILLTENGQVKHCSTPSPRRYCTPSPRRRRDRAVLDAVAEAGAAVVPALTEGAVDPQSVRPSVSTIWTARRIGASVSKKYGARRRRRASWGDSTTRVTRDAPTCGRTRRTPAAGVGKDVWCLGCRRSRRAAFQATASLTGRVACCTRGLAAGDGVGGGCEHYAGRGPDTPRVASRSCCAEGAA